MMWWSCCLRLDLFTLFEIEFIVLVRYLAKVLFLKLMVILRGWDRVILGYSTPFVLLSSAVLMSFSKSTRLGGEEGHWGTVWVMLCSYHHQGGGGSLVNKNGKRCSADW